VGAGAIAAKLLEADADFTLTPEACAAAAAFRSRSPLSEVASGQELVERGFGEDVRLAEQLDADDVVPILQNGRYVAAV
jgi:2-phosphosulfolactate phosphatase